MVGPQYDLVGNPLGVVRATFERAAASAVESGGGGLVAAFRRRTGAPVRCSAPSSSSKAGSTRFRCWMHHPFHCVLVSENGNGECSSFGEKPKEDDVQISPSSAEMPVSEHHTPEMNGGDHHIPGSSFSCLVKVSDMLESQVKLNDVSEFIGVYTFDPELAAPSDNLDDIMFDLIEDVTAQLPPRRRSATFFVIL